MKENRILAVGSAALDDVKTPFGRVKNALGGSVVYFSASARFFSPVSIVAVIGRDFPPKHITLLNKLKIDTRGLETAPGKTFHWSGYYDFDLNSAKTLKTELNVFQNFRPKLSPEQKNCRSLFLANIDPELQHEVLSQARGARLKACDTMNYWIENKKKSLLGLLRKVDIFLCNESEARELTGEYNLLKAARWVLSRGPKLFILKKGEHGVICAGRVFLFLAPAYLLEKVFDPTGAGDSFAGGFMGYVTRAGSLGESVVRRAIIYGSVLASYNVESFSLARLASLRRSEVQARYKVFKNLTGF
jgi:sugar/nucleoside kinase (ribokinase family)